MEKRFGDPIGDRGPIEYLEKAGYILTEDWRWIPRLGVKTLEDMTQEEYECLLFLVQEWDFGSLVTDSK
jgi:hypothetical protein